MGKRDLQSDGDRSEKLAGGSVLRAVVDLLPKGETVESTSVGTEGCACDPVKHQECDLRLDEEDRVR